MEKWTGLVDELLDIASHAAWHASVALTIVLFNAFHYLLHCFHSADGVAPMNQFTADDT